MLNAIRDECLLASFADWNPTEYLTEYYSEVEADEQYTFDSIQNSFVPVIARK